VHERIGIRVAVESLGVGDVHAAEDEFAAFDKLMDIVAYANVNHAKGFGFKFSGFRLATGGRTLNRRQARSAYAGLPPLRLFTR